MHCSARIILLLLIVVLNSSASRHTEKRMHCFHQQQVNNDGVFEEGSSCERVERNHSASLLMSFLVMANDCNLSLTSSFPACHLKYFNLCPHNNTVTLLKGIEFQCSSFNSSLRYLKYIDVSTLLGQTLSNKSRGNALVIICDNRSRDHGNGRNMVRREAPSTDVTNSSEGTGISESTPPSQTTNATQHPIPKWSTTNVSSESNSNCTSYDEHNVTTLETMASTVTREITTYAATEFTISTTYVASSTQSPTTKASSLLTTTGESTYKTNYGGTSTISVQNTSLISASASTKWQYRPLFIISSTTIIGIGIVICIGTCCYFIECRFRPVALRPNRSSRKRTLWDRTLSTNLDIPIFEVPTVTSLGIRPIDARSGNEYTITAAINEAARDSITESFCGTLLSSYSVETFKESVDDIRKSKYEMAKEKQRSPASLPQTPRGVIGTGNKSGGSNSKKGEPFKESNIQPHEYVTINPSQTTEFDLASSPCLPSKPLMKIAGSLGNLLEKPCITDGSIMGTNYRLCQSSESVFQSTTNDGSQGQKGAGRHQMGSSHPKMNRTKPPIAKKPRLDQIKKSTYGQWSGIKVLPITSANKGVPGDPTFVRVKLNSSTYDTLDRPMFEGPYKNPQGTDDNSNNTMYAVPSQVLAPHYLQSANTSSQRVTEETDKRFPEKAFADPQYDLVGPVLDPVLKTGKNT